MEKEFIPYEQALALKELGFDEPCIGVYNTSNKKLFVVTPNKDESFEYLNIPLYQQAFEYILKSYLRKYSIRVLSDGSGAFYDDDNYSTDFRDKDSCLKKLIEIVKQK